MMETDISDLKMTQRSLIAAQQAQERFYASVSVREHCSDALYIYIYIYIYCASCIFLSSFSVHSRMYNVASMRTGRRSALSQPLLLCAMIVMR